MLIMTIEQKRIEGLLKWVGLKYGNEFRNEVASHSPHSEGEFWAAFRQTRACRELRDKRPFSLGRLRCNS